jgi:hypothetical protein
MGVVGLGGREAGGGQRYDLVLVAVRAEQLASTLPILTGMSDRL